MAAKQTHWITLACGYGQGRKTDVVTFQLIERRDQCLQVSSQFERRRIRIQLAGARQGQTKQLGDRGSGAQQCSQRRIGRHAAMLRAKQHATLGFSDYCHGKMGE